MLSSLDLTRDDSRQLLFPCYPSQVRNVLRVAQVPREQTSLLVRYESSSKKGVSPAAGMRSQCSNGLAEALLDGTCQCSLQGQVEPVEGGWLEVASP